MRRTKPDRPPLHYSLEEPSDNGCTKEDIGPDGLRIRKWREPLEWQKQQASEVQQEARAQGRLAMGLVRFSRDHHCAYWPCGQGSRHAQRFVAGRALARVALPTSP